jgi:hypothetical protein
VLEGPGFIGLVLNVGRPNQAQTRTGEKRKDDAENGPGKARIHPRKPSISDANEPEA